VPHDSASLSFAVRPSRGRFALARVALLLQRSEGGLPLGALGFVIGALLGVGALELLVALPWRLGPRAVLEIALGQTLPVAAIFAAGAAALALASLREGDALDADELSGGVLLQLAPTGIAATVRGATTVHDWVHVTVHEVAHGFAFVLPHRAFHLLPFEDIGGATEIARLRGLLAHRLRDPDERLLPFSEWPERSTRISSDKMD
jgi:hypothetical protein